MLKLAVYKFKPDGTRAHVGWLGWNKHDYILPVADEAVEVDGQAAITHAAFFLTAAHPELGHDEFYFVWPEKV